MALLSHRKCLKCVFYCCHTLYCHREYDNTTVKFKYDHKLFDWQMKTTELKKKKTQKNGNSAIFSLLKYIFLEASVEQINYLDYIFIKWSMCGCLSNQELVEPNLFLCITSDWGTKKKIWISLKKTKTLFYPIRSAPTQIKMLVFDLP